MKSDFKKLKILEGEIETLIGLDVNEIFIGGVFGGVYKPSLFQSYKKIADFCLTEISIFMLTFIFTLPIGLLTIRNYSNSINN